MVNPQELRLEEPYIAEAIKGTRRAFQLDHIERQTFVPAPKLTPTICRKERTRLRTFVSGTVHPYWRRIVNSSS